MKLSKEDYVARIASATPLQLVIINYEIILDYLHAAEESINDDKAFNFAVSKARAFLGELRASLDMQYDISKNLMSLYIYTDKQMAYYMINKKDIHLQETKKVLNGLLEGWKAIENDEKDKTPLMENAQQLYAGLTYDRSGRLTEYIEPDSKRGFKA